MGRLGIAAVTFSQAIMMAGLTEKQLRNWLDKRQVPLRGSAVREEGAWRRFSVVDVIRFALIGAIVRYGFKVAESVEVVDHTVTPRLLQMARFIPDRSQARADVLRASFLGHALFLWTGDAATGLGRSLNFYQSRSTDELKEISRKQLRHYVAIDVEQIVADVVAWWDPATWSDETEASDGGE